MDDWTYKGVSVSRHGRNTMGLRWIARPNFYPYVLRADSKRSMRSLVNAYRKD